MRSTAARTGRALLVLLVTGLLVAAGSPASASLAEPPRDVVVIGVPGMSWSDVTRETTPAIWDLADDGAVANLNVRSTYFTSCPVDGWLGLSAGDRAAEPRDVSDRELRADPRALPDCGPLPTLPGPGSDALTAVEVSEADAAAWRGTREEIAANGFDARIGRLGQQIADTGACVHIGGAGSYLGARTEDGLLPELGPMSGQDGGCPVSLLGADPITRPEPGPERLAQVTAADRLVSDTVDGLPEDTLVLVAGLSDDGGTPGLRVLVASGGGIEPGWLASDSTSRTGMAQVADLTYTALQTSGLGAPEGTAGRALTVQPDDAPLRERQQRLVDDDAQLVVGDEVLPTFFRTFGIALAVLVLSLALGWRRAGERGRAILAPVSGVVGLGAMALPAATFLATVVPWWRAGSPGWALTGVVVGIIAALLALTAALVLGLGRLVPGAGGARGRALAAVGSLAAVTAGILALDLLLDEGRMTMLGVLGLHPLDGGRFHGFGNVPFALFATSALLAITALADPLLRTGRRRAVVAVVAVLGLLTVVVDAAPWLGADGGGALALTPAVGYLVLAVAQVRLTWRTALGLVVVTGFAFLGMAWLDWLRPEAQRTHLGRFFQSLLDGEALGIVLRKLETNVDILLGPERTALLVPVGLVLIILVLARPDSRPARPVRPLLALYPALRPGLIAIVVALTAGFLLNDSGTAIPAVAALILVPGLLALAMLSRPAWSRTETTARPAPSAGATTGSDATAR